MVCGDSENEVLMTAKAKQQTHTVTLRLKTSEYDHYMFSRRFHALAHLHNVMVKHAKKLLIRLNHDKEYPSLRQQYASSDDKHARTVLSKQMKDIRLAYGLTDYSFQKYLAVCGRQYRKLLSSQQVQKEASRVYASVERYLFGNGRSIHYKKYRDFDTIGGKSNLNGVCFDRSSLSVIWFGESYPCFLPRDDNSRDYISEALNADVSYCELKRIMFPNGWHYYVVIILKGPAPRKLKTIGSNTCGIDPGVSTMACVSDDKAFFFELAPDSRKYDKKIADIQYHMDLSKRACNPGKYNSDGTVNKNNHDPWNYSRSYRRMRDHLKYLFRKKAAYTKQSHEIQCNKLLADSVNFIVEDMNYKALSRRSRHTERQAETSQVTGNDGTIKTVHKYKRKKRFGRSIGNRAPAQFLSILKQKAEFYGGAIVRVNTKTYKASQYDHTTDTYTKIPLSQRSKRIDGHRVQRDLYSAFLILNTNDSLDHPERNKCLCTFDSFLRHQATCIHDMINSNTSMPQCFGF